MNTVLKLLKKNSLVLAGVVALLAVFWFLASQPASQVPVTENLPGEEPIASSSDEITTNSTKRSLPAEPTFSIPDGATKVDEYAFTKDGRVHFRSLTSDTPLEIPNSDGKSFERLAEFKSYTGGSVVAECGAAPQYSYYADNRQVYFYQIWRAPEFRSSRIEVIVNAQKEDFVVQDSGNSYDDSYRYTLGYAVATSTCWLELSRSKK